MRKREIAVVLSRFSRFSSKDIIALIGYLSKKSNKDFGKDSIDAKKIVLAKEILNNKIYSDVISDLARGDIYVTTLFDDDYPKQLKNIDDPPVVLYYQGSIEIINSERIFAVVGSRKASQYGLGVAKQFTNALSEYGFIIVSGLALGIDTQAHRSSIEAGGKTIAVLGTSIDKIYPALNGGLKNKIVSTGGLIISENPPKVPTEKYHFIYRNRIIAGLSEGLLICEAGENSGALATARYAINYGKDVYCVPADINRQTAKGSNMLISEGSYCATSVNDFLSCLGIKKQNNNRAISDEQQALIDLIEKFEGNFDRIQAELKISRQHLNVMLMEMEIEGLVKKNIFGDYEQV